MTSKYFAKEFPDIGVIAIVDLHGAKSVTNDAEAVVENVGKTFGGLAKWRIIYRDSFGEWDELEHDGEAFTGFKLIVGERVRSLSDALERLGLPRHHGENFDLEVP